MAKKKEDIKVEDVKVDGVIKLEKTKKDGSKCRMTVPSKKDITPLMKSDPRIKEVKEWTK